MRKLRPSVFTYPAQIQPAQVTAVRRESAAKPTLSFTQAYPGKGGLTLDWYTDLIRPAGEDYKTGKQVPHLQRASQSSSSWSVIPLKNGDTV